MDNGVLCATEQEAMTVLLLRGISRYTAEKAVAITCKKGSARIFYGGGKCCYLDIVSRPDQDAAKKIMVSFDGPGTSPENPAYSN